MKVAKLTDVKNELSRYVDQVRRGGRVRILVQGVAAADLVPVQLDTKGNNGNAMLDDLERRGMIQRGRGTFPKELLREAPAAKGRPASTELIASRRAAR